MTDPTPRVGNTVDGRDVADVSLTAVHFDGDDQWTPLRDLFRLEPVEPLVVLDPYGVRR